MQEDSIRNNNHMSKTYLQEHYNIRSFHELGKTRIQNMAARITNSITAALNQVHGLPHFLVIVSDKDILSAMNVFDEDIEPVLRKYVNWMVRQISILVRRKKAELLDKKPGAIYAGDPVIIFTRMIRRPANLGRAKTQKVYFLRAKFNDALNDAVARID